MKHILLLLAVAAVSTVLASCSQNANASAKNFETGIIEETTESIAEAEPYEIRLSEQQQTFVNDNNAFTLKFLKTVNDEDKSGKSFIYSPLSITYVLSMVNAAAEGNTQRELEQTLGFREGGIKAVNEFCKTLIDSLPLVDKKVQLHIANAIFVNKNNKLQSQFQKDMQKYFDAKAESLDFTSKKSLERINGWCNKKTKGMIPSIIDELNPDAVSYLLNAIYFKANWTNEFEEYATKTEAFTTAGGKVDMPLMHQIEKFRYMKNSTFAAVDLPYGNKQWSMTVLLPEEGKTTDDVINYLANDGMSFLSDFRGRRVDLKLPRFETESATEDLIRTLKKLGINRVFGSGSEIPNMCDANVFISMMLQKARIKVNETGSEAAAVTVAVMEKMSAPVRPLPPEIFHADRPFVYMIREASTGVILFVGKFTGL
ncbi:MAG: serpin family protein [Bacteroidales bacterium]|nr:serpin family protein [Bacteroidales bacterium]